ncbi:MAG: hypothetical protein ABSF17_12725 [Terracidiphilus sp.]|jgi:hypothetical protein
MRATRLAALTLTVLVGLSIGCKNNTVDKSGFKSALNTYYKGQQDCLWASPQKFPAQADTSNDEQTKGYDALVDAGLLTRASAEKKRFLVGSKQVNNYDISAKGRSTWTPDQTQPGYGNFCLGHPEVVSVDSYTPADPNASQYTVNYRYGITSVPDWANTTEMKTAYPRIVRQSSGASTGTATLTKSNDGWQVSNVQPTPATEGGQ